MSARGTPSRADRPPARLLLPPREPHLCITADLWPAAAAPGGRVTPALTAVQLWPRNTRQRGPLTRRTGRLPLAGVVLPQATGDGVHPTA